MAITHDYVDYATGNDYKGATFNDGAFTVADMTLTKAGAFAASKANHWLYLDDNGSGEVTTGYYRIASVTSDDAVVLAASPKSGANDPTDVVCTQHAGTALLPWRSLQGACDLLTRNVADGNQVNLKAGTAQVNAAALDLTTLIAGGALSGAGPLIIRGYTATANDGGIGEIDCGGATMFAATTYDYVQLFYLEIHTGGDNNLVDLDQSCVMFACEVHKGASSPSGKRLVNFGINGIVIGNFIHDQGEGGSFGIILSSPGHAFNNYVVVNDMTQNGEGIRFARRGVAVGNIVLVTGAASYGISGLEGIANGNIVVSTAGASLSGAIKSMGVATVGGAVALNNIACGASVGIESNGGIVGYNAYYNNTSNTSVTDVQWVDLSANDVALAADPFVDAANGDFSLTDAAKLLLRSAGWPSSYLGASTDPHITIGAVQYGAAEAGGGGVIRRAMRMIGG